MRFYMKRARRPSKFLSLFMRLGTGPKVEIPIQAPAGAIQMRLRK
jgi:hypothetical protein